MSTTELSRSKLESKDKDELHQIANAMGGKPGSRARKAEIVDLILDLAGVGSSSRGSSGSSSRSSGAKATPAASDGGGQEPAAETESAAAGGDAAKDDAAANGATAASDAASTPRDPAPARPNRQSSFSFDPMADARAEAAAKRARENGETPDDASGEPAATDRAERSDRADADQSKGDDAAADRKGDGQDKADQQGDGQDEAAQSNTDQSKTDQSKSAEPEAGQSKSAEPEAGQQGDGQGKGGQQGDGQGKGDAQGKGGQQGGGQGKGQDNRQQGQNQQDNRGGDDAEPGNRKRRRRGRNRDRDRDDQQGNQQGGQRDDWDGEPVEVNGYLDLRDDGYGFLRVKGFLPSKDDVYVSVKQARQYGLRKGDQLKGASRPAGRSEKNPALLRIDEVNGMKPEQAQRRPKFEDLTPLFPDQKLKLERPDDPTNMTARIIDLIAPIGKGQRGLIVSPPKAGKTTIMKEIARSIELNNPEVKVLVLLVDERPEEVTDMRRWLVRGDVVASTFDRPSDEHTMVAELTIERAKRMVEMGEDVVIILDGITRLARAYNLAAPATGRIMSGGVDSGALYPPKRFFGAARNVEEGGSLTILATALVETGSKMDEVIFEEFKGTGNMELRLDRRTAERRIYPAIDVDASSTRHEELLFERKQLQQVWKLRRVLSGMAADGANAPGLELLIDRLKTFNSNDEFLAEVARGPVG